LNKILTGEDGLPKWMTHGHMYCVKKTRKGKHGGQLSIIILFYPIIFVLGMIPMSLILRKVKE